MMIDFHSHCFPDALAPKALSQLSERAGIIPLTDGTAAGTLASMMLNGIDVSVICNIAVTPHQQRKVNDFAIGLRQYPGFFPLGSVNPLSEDAADELKRLSDAGIRGIKIHPDYMRVRIDDPRFGKIFSFCAENGIFVVTHAGFDPVSPEMVFADPEAIRTVCNRYPGLKLVAAHFGSNMMWDETERYLVGTGCYIDTSLGYLNGLRPKQALRIINGHDPDRLLFASDLPWGDPKLTADYINGLGLSDTLKEKIFWRNAARLLDIPV